MTEALATDVDSEEKYLKRLPAIRVPEYLYKRIMDRVEREKARLPRGYKQTDILRNVLDAWSREDVNR